MPEGGFWLRFNGSFAVSPKEAKSAFSASSPLPEGEVARTSSTCRSSGRSATTTGGCWTGSRRRHERFRKSVLLFNLVVG